jgi:hypothetical protein
LDLAHVVSLLCSGMIFNMPKIYDMRPMTILSTRIQSCYGLSPLKIPSSSAGYEPVKLGFNVKHNNHYTTQGEKKI